LLGGKKLRDRERPVVVLVDAAISSFVSGGSQTKQA